MIFHSLYLIAYTSIQPHTDSKRTAIEIFNEIVLMIFMYHLAGWNGLILDLQMQFDVGYVFIFVILMTLMVNTGLIVYKTVDDWRHRRSVELNRLLILEKFEKLKTDQFSDINKKADKLRARNDFIMRRMLEADAHEDLPKEVTKQAAPLTTHSGQMQTIQEENSVENSMRDNHLNALKAANDALTNQ